MRKDEFCVLPSLVVKTNISKSLCKTGHASSISKAKSMSIRFTLIGLLIFLTAIVAHASYTSLRILADNNENVHEYSEHIIPSLKFIAGLNREIGRFRSLEAEHILASYPEHTEKKKEQLAVTQKSIEDYLIN